MSQDYKCVKCGNSIKKKIEYVKYATVLDEDEVEPQIRYLLENNEFDKIKSYICFECFKSYIKVVEEKKTEVIDNQNNLLYSLKNLLLDISKLKVDNNSKNMDEITKKKQNIYNNLKKSNEEYKNEIKKNKEILQNLIKEQQDLDLQINKKNKERENSIQIIKKLELKLKYIKEEEKQLNIKDK